MGFFKTLKSLFRLMKDAPKLAQAIKEQQSAYGAMTTEDLAALSDEELFSAVVVRLESLMDYEQPKASFAALSSPQKVVYAVNCLEVEVNNGGLCQFFVNSSRMVAPYISEYLGIIGAEEHKLLFDGFITKNCIDLNDLSSFKIRHVKDFDKQVQRYPFDEYDDAFYGLPSLEEPVTAYIRSNLSSF